MAEVKAGNAAQQAVEALKLNASQEQGGRTVFRDATNLYYPTERIYGGQMTAQAMIAAADTTDESKVVNSIHATFIKVGKLDEETRYEVESLRDGRSFSTRRVDARQGEQLLFTATVSLQKAGQSGVEFSDAMPSDLPDPETLTSAKDLMEPYADKSGFAKYYASQSPFDIRHIGSTVMLAPDKESANADSGKQMVWMRMASPVTASRNVHRALLALECDQVMMEPDLRRAGLSISTPGIFYASIDHSMWFYDDIDMNEWHLYVQDAPVAGHGRALGIAKVYSVDGRMLAAMTQEATIRVPEKKDEKKK
ncbi:acyl-CoA thioesterase domain-containing protein [Bifidobacterium sp. ESL0764]|uniref:acyl-CoA thioesterase n=1 Tax=Bifidobacterium sp. ESL0764 TaxID=2983228 RepID=UPI0023F6A531|nr:acyl-CoA thioesterase domain-containing protein [Bifidobacterium sp. ESL0764]WEV65369.1 thioesterase family protein [Bifidobacterium sp. ESL0764]